MHMQMHTRFQKHHQVSGVSHNIIHAIFLKVLVEVLSIFTMSLSTFFTHQEQWASVHGLLHLETM